MYETLNLGVPFIFCLIIFNYSTNLTICGVFFGKNTQFYTFFYKSVSAIELLSYLLLPVPSHNIRLVLNL